MKESFYRTELLIGKSSLDKLKLSRVAVFGVGGVGSFTVEALARAGIGNIDIFDGDKIDITNINRQLIATCENVGEDKVLAMKRRILSINPDAKVVANKCIFGIDNHENYDFKKYDYIVDAIDMISSKILIVTKAKSLGIKVISSMGMGNKIEPSVIEIDDIFSTSVCPLARVMRRELKKRNINSLKVAYSKEKPIYTPNNKVNASISFVPSVAGLLIAGEVVKDLIKCT